MKLLIIDRDRDLVEMLSGWLKMHGYEVYRAYESQQAKTLWLEQQPDMVLVDPNLKEANALALCRDLQRKHDALILVLTAGNDVQDEIQALESGADDYLRKPFFPSQLMARIRSVSRRARTSLEQRPSSLITVGPLTIDSLHNQVKVNDNVMRLTPTESKLLHFLAINANDVCTAEQIVMHVWGYNGDGDASLIKAHIRHIRQKIESVPSSPRFILAVPGVGYTLVRRSTEKSFQESA